MIDVDRLPPLTDGQSGTTPSAATGEQVSAHAARSATDRQTRFRAVDVDPDGVMLWTVDSGPNAGDWIATLEPDGAWLVVAEAANGMGGAWVLPLHHVEVERQREVMRRWLTQLVGPKLAGHVVAAWARASAPGAVAQPS